MTDPEPAPTPRPRPLSHRRVIIGLPGRTVSTGFFDIVGQLRDAGIRTRGALSAEAADYAGLGLIRSVTGEAPIVDGVALAAQLERSNDTGADAMLILDADTATLARLARGIPDDAVTVAALSVPGPILLVPSPGAAGGAAGGEISETLSARGVGILEETEPRRIAGRVIARLIDSGPGVPVLVTAGGTREPLDPVRFLSNRSSGRTGAAIAEAARNAGHPVTLVRGAGVGAATPPGVEEIVVETAQDMLARVQHVHKMFKVFIMCAAVADYRPAEFSTTKIRRDRDKRVLELQSNPDILASVRDERRGLVTVGFAIEGGLDEAALAGARRKLESKGLTFIVLNDPERSDTAFGGPTARARIVWRDPAPRGTDPVENLPTMSKQDLGREIVERAISALEDEERS
jgi:phosphopantothenoylcysteine decarboxylase/phosphopantothenate--cysteine ligase